MFTVILMSGFGPNERLRGPGLEIRGRWAIICLGLTSHAGSLLWLSPPLVRNQRSEDGEHVKGKRARRGKEKKNEKISHTKCWLIPNPAAIETANALLRQRNPRCQKAITCG